MSIVKRVFDNKDTRHEVSLNIVEDDVGDFLVYIV